MEIKSHISVILAGETPEQAMQIIVRNTMEKHGFKVYQGAVDTIAHFIVMNNYCTDTSRFDQLVFVKEPEGFMTFQNDVRAIAWNALKYWERTGPVNFPGPVKSFLDLYKFIRDAKE